MGATTEAGRLYGLIGRKLGHSFSQTYFRDKFRHLGLGYDYLLFELPDVAHFPMVASRYPTLCGLNVTIPYKTQIINQLAYLDPVAARVGAVNTLARESGNRWRGYNTDWLGFQADVQAFIEGAEKTALANVWVLGGGGSARAVLEGLHVLGAEHITCVVRPESRLDTATLRCQTVRTYPEVSSTILRAATLVVNTTPAGMYPDLEALPPIPVDGFRAGQWVYDLIYNPAETRLLAAARHAGAQTRNGLGMLRAQAEAAWQIWQTTPHDRA
jgi:shikimate dehydrogenase